MIPDIREVIMVKLSAGPIRQAPERIVYALDMTKRSSSSSLALLMRCDFKQRTLQQLAPGSDQPVKGPAPTWEYLL